MAEGNDDGMSRVAGIILVGIKSRAAVRVGFGKIGIVRVRWTTLYSYALRSTLKFSDSRVQQRKSRRSIKVYTNDLT